MGAIKDKIFDIYYTAKDVLFPLFHDKWNCNDMDFAVSNLKPGFQIRVGTDSGNKYYRVDLSSMPFESYSWSKEQYIDFFKKVYEVLILCPLTDREVSGEPEGSYTILDMYHWKFNQ